MAAKGQAVLPRYDQALRNAKNLGKRIKVELAMSTSFTDAEGVVEGDVLEVDKFAVKIRTTAGREPWIFKSMIVGTEVLA